jgi:deoxyribodipyrimidine photo-lyase
MIQKERIKKINKNLIKDGNYVLYWMQASQRTEYNHALEFAVLPANELERPLLVYFGLTNDFPEANERHYYFVLEGLKEVKAALRKRGIKFVIQNISPDFGAIELAKNASLVVVDGGYLRIQKKWRKDVARKINCPLFQVETDVIIPIETTSNKEEFAARTIRPKIHKQLDKFLLPVIELKPKIPSVNLNIDSLNLDDINSIISKLNIDRTVKKVDFFTGGTNQAKTHLDNFINFKIKSYSEQRNDLTKENLSNMSPYLHFGQISPLFIAREVMKNSLENSDTYLEELIIRRELSMNFINFNDNYDKFEGLPDWAKKTLCDHKNDSREYFYDLEDWENAKTHDPFWNAAQLEMVYTGKMHGYMRMYWGKKILEWGPTPEEAFQTTIYLKKTNMNWMDEIPMVLPVWPGVLESMIVLGLRDQYLEK